MEAEQTNQANEVSNEEAKAAADVAEGTSAQGDGDQGAEEKAE